MLNNEIYVKYFKDLYEIYIKLVKRYEKKVGVNNKVFLLIKYVNYLNEWGLWNVCEFKSVISILVSVGIN